MGTPDIETPLIVDLDGTLIKTDLLVETGLALALAAPLQAISALFLKKAARKAYVAERITPDWSHIPLNTDVLAFLQQEKSRGRKLYLASGSDARYVNEIAERLEIFDGVLASDGTVNLSGKTKAERLCTLFGEGGFDYIGNALVDIPVWEAARNAYVVAVQFFILQRIKRQLPSIITIGGPEKRIKDYLQAMRIYQWVKNLLIFVPAFTAHEFMPALFHNLIAFLAFSFGASSCYLLNDLFDLGHDRANPAKRERALASGRVNPDHGAVLVLLLLAGAGLLSLCLPFQFSLLLIAYYISTCAYTLWLKRLVILDVVVLACFYGVRLIAGSVATGIMLSPWLAGFSLFFFLFLALIKRCVELSNYKYQNIGAPAGRGYQIEDLGIMQAMAIASGYVSVLVLALYINSSAVAALHRYPERLWLLCVLLIYWISRIMLLVSRRQMHSDPVLFAIKDKASLIVLALSFVVFAIST